MDIGMHTFLGANSENGFISLYDAFISDKKRVYVIKGGPGTGKSTLMKKIDAKSSEKGYTTEKIHCSSDPDSLDGLYIEELKTCVVDGTFPHLQEPPLPGAVGRIINLYPFWDNDFLYAQTDIIRKINAEISLLYDRAYLYIGASGKLQRDLYKIGAMVLNTAKLKGYFERLAAKNIKPIHGKPKEHKRFISSVSPKGFITYSDIFNKDSIKTLVIDDEYGISSKALEIIKYKALKYGHTVYSFYSPVIPNIIEHIYIPASGFAVFTSNSMHKLIPKPYCRINISRFFKADAEKQNKYKTAFLKKARDEIINEAVKILSSCKEKHNSLEEIYKTAVDYQKLNEYTDMIIKEILQ